MSLRIVYKKYRFIISGDAKYIHRFFMLEYIDIK